MGASWCKRYSKSNGTESSLQDMLNRWADRINCGNEETKWNWKWARRRQTKWKDRPEISSPRLINPCFLQGAKWDNVILSVPDPEMKSRIPVAPPRRKRKRPLGTDQAQVYQTLSFPDFRHRCFDLGTDTSMSLSSLDPVGPRSPRTPRSPWTHRGPRRLSLDYSDCDCSLSSRTSLASIPVTDELYRKHHFLSVSGQSFNMTQASLLSASTSSFKRNQHQKRRKTLQSIAHKYNLTLSLPNLNNLFSKYGSRGNGIRRELCTFSSLPDLLRPNDVTKEAVMYAMLYGIKSDYGSNFRVKGATFARGIKHRPRKDGENQLMRKSGGFQGKPPSQLSVSRFGSNFADTIQEGSDAVYEDPEEDLTRLDNQSKAIGQDMYNVQTSPKQRKCTINMADCTVPIVDRRGSVSRVEGNDLQSDGAGRRPTNDLNSAENFGERSLGYEEVKCTVSVVKTSSVWQEPGLVEVQIHEVPASPKSQNVSSTDSTISSHKLEDKELYSHRSADSKSPPPYDNANKENFDSNLLFKYRNLSKFKSPRYLKTFRRLSQRQTEKVGCPLFFDKHHSCSCLRPRGQRFQSMSALPSERPSKFSLKNGLIKKSLSVNHSQQGRKMDRIFKSSLCVSQDDCCSHENKESQNFNDRNNNFSKNGCASLGGKSFQSNGNVRILVNGAAQKGESDCVGVNDKSQHNRVSSVNGPVENVGNDCVPLSDVSAQNRENGCIYIANGTISGKGNNCASPVNELVQSYVDDCIVMVNGSIQSGRKNSSFLVDGTAEIESVRRFSEEEAKNGVIKSNLNSKIELRDLKNTSEANKFNQALDSIGQTGGNFSSTKIPIVFDEPNILELQHPALSANIIEKFGDCDKSVKSSNQIENGVGSPKLPIVSDEQNILRFQNSTQGADSEIRFENNCSKWDSEPPTEQLRTIVTIGDVTLSRRSSTSDSLCELEDAIYDMLVVSSTNQQTAEVKT